MMKVSGPSGPTSVAPAKAAARAQGGFSVSSSAATPATAGASPVQASAGVGSIGALLALQSVGTPLESKRRAVKRAGRILDVLDEIKVGLLDGVVSKDSLDRLVASIREQREETDDPRLEGVLNEIEMRAAVELAKLETR